jgi:hypothetical protein
MTQFKKPIETIEEYQDVMKRVTELYGSKTGTAEKDELQSLTATLEKWDHDHGRQDTDIRRDPRDPFHRHAAARH